MLERTGCDGISVGRGAQGRPWIFRDIVAAYHGAPIPAGPTLAEVIAVIERHAAWCVVDQGQEERALREMRKHIGWYLRGWSPPCRNSTRDSANGTPTSPSRPPREDHADGPAARKPPTCPTAGWTTPT